MPPLDQLQKFIVTSLAILVIPGPSVLFVISRSLTLGRAAGAATVLGNSLGAFTQMVLVSLGLGTIVSKSITAYNVVKFAGAAYLIYLGIQAFRHRGGTTVNTTIDAAPKSVGRIIREGYVVGVTNPKLLVYASATLPLFVDRDRGRVPLQMLVLSALFTTLACCSDGAYAMLAGTARNKITSSPKTMSRLAGAGGIAIVGLGINLALSRRKS